MIRDLKDTRLCLNIPVCDVRLNKTEHLLCRLSDLYENAVVDLQEAEKLQDLAGLGCYLIDTTTSQLLSLQHSTTLLTHEYERRSTPSLVREHRSRQMREQHASNESPLAPRTDTP